MAIVGAGVSGLVTAWLLSRAHDVHVFEAAERAGGHTHTVELEERGRRLAIDTGFIVFNGATYPNFVRLLERLGVAWQPSSMSFGVRDEASGLEYNGTSIGALFAQRSNLLKPSFHRMWVDILRFHEAARRLALSSGEELALGAFLEQGGWSEQLVRHYVVPIGAAIWSAPPRQMLDFPARYFARFLHNHGMLSVSDRPIWRVVRGGSARYVEALIAPFRERVRLSTPVSRVRRGQTGVEIESAQGREAFDALVLATHCDSALALLEDASALERELLGAIPYQPNEAVLHSDASVMPRARRAWAAWNSLVPARESERVAITYWMNCLQGLDAEREYFVTLNQSARIDPALIWKRIQYAHPLYTPAGVAAQARVARELNGQRHTYYCGAWCGFGFHEDGVRSALEVGRHFGAGAIA